MLVINEKARFELKNLLKDQILLSNGEKGLFHDSITPELHDFKKQLYFVLDLFSNLLRTGWGGAANEPL